MKESNLTATQSNYRYARPADEIENKLWESLMGFVDCVDL